jgi:hypothetical protein
MKFILHDRSKKSPLYFLIDKNRKGHRVFLKYPVGITLTPAQWNDKKQAVREIAGLPYAEWNKSIKKIREDAERFFRLNDFFEITPDNVREMLDVELGRKEEANVKEFADYLQGWIERNKLKKGYSTIKSWVTLSNKLPTNMTWKDFDFVFYRNFISEMESQDYSLNYIGKMIKNLKIVLNHAWLEGVNKNTEYKKWKVPSEKVYNVYLSEEELLRIHRSNPPGYLHGSKDLFVLGCFTGLRVENYLNIDPDLQIKNGIITAIINKKGGRVKIPVHWIVDEIIKKNKGLPPPVTSQTLNKHIKLICQFAGIKEKIITVKTVGGKRKEFVKEKWEMCSSHTARRSMVTNLYMRNVPIRYIMSITGHKTELQCQEYIKSGIDEFLDQVINLDFWKK